MGRRLITLVAAALILIADVAGAQSATVLRNSNLRSDPSTDHPPVALLHAGDGLTLVSSNRQAGYYHAVSAAQDSGWVWSKNVRVGQLSADVAAIVPPTAARAATTTTVLNVAGSASFAGCGDGLWKHVYHPTRLLIKQACITVTGVIVDATATQSTHHADGMRHEGDGDTHGWLKLDPQFRSLLNAGNMSNENGNLVFEFVCHYSVTQPSAQSACAHFTDHTVLPPIGTHVAIAGSYVQDDNHAKWMEIHPVSGIKKTP